MDTVQREDTVADMVLVEVNVDLYEGVSSTFFSLLASISNVSSTLIIMLTC